MMYGPFGGWGMGGLLGFANEVIWFVVGVLLIVWLWNHVGKKGNQDD